MTDRPLTDTERRAAEEIGQGALKKNVARDTLGGTVSQKLRPLLKRDDFDALIEQARTKAAGPPAPTAPPASRPGITEEEEVLEMTMRARNQRGDPTPLAMQAAIALAKLRAAKAEERAATATVERELVTLDAELDEQVRRILDEAHDGESVLVAVAARDCGPNATGTRLVGLHGGLWRPYKADPSVPWGSAPTDAGAARGPLT